ncbi:hypothetical protein [Thioclava sp. F36-7]|uniref:dCTP deaminase domain-containing protein n=1 Tax=Thioclava sp. F36-7 TaxID=1915317 RepID=UPI0009C787E6|nr:hypothetical protein [Thioclava sp. F36-7]OOY09811.1 hypothetical protein BMI89_03090 [Thioclava sp. F36-7]
MLIVEKRIHDRKLVTPQVSNDLKNSTLDLKVGEIFPHGNGKAFVGSNPESFLLEAGHMVTVMSAQRLTLPSNVTGIATLVTSLTSEGILCLNVGVVDPGYSGHLSATLVNFSSSAHKIRRNDRLFRVVFIEHEEIENLQENNVGKNEYRAKLKANTQQCFPETFMNTEEIVQLARKNAWEVVKASLLNNWFPLLLSALALLFTVLQYVSSD